MILASESPDDDDLEDERFYLTFKWLSQELLSCSLDSTRFIEIYQEATDVYGLIHARFITSPKGKSFNKLE